MRKQTSTTSKLLIIATLLTGIVLLSSGITLLSMSACDPAESSTSQTATDTEQNVVDTEQSMIGTEQPFISESCETDPIQIRMELSRSPKLGETAELTFTIIPHHLLGKEITYSRAWVEAKWKNTTGSFLESRQKIEIPTVNILASSESSWDITLTEGEPVEMYSTIKFTQEGDWEINGILDVDDWGSIKGNPIRLAVYQDRTGIVASAAYAAGELEWMKDYSPGTGMWCGTDEYPLGAVLDLAKPPRLNEPVELTWSVVSYYDAEKFKAQVYFRLKNSGEPGSTLFSSKAMLVEGDLEWDGPLNNGVPVSSSAIIKFPEEGDWEIWMECTDIINNSDAGSNIRLNVTEERGRWGWAESHRAVTGDVPLPPPVDKLPTTLRSGF